MRLVPPSIWQASNFDHWCQFDIGAGANLQSALAVLLYHTHYAAALATRNWPGTMILTSNDSLWYLHSQ
jgi:hypothetical protein